MTWTGGCQCGASRFTIGARALAVYACHCRECQRQATSAFGISVPVRQTDFQVSGPLKRWARATESGGRTACWFCGECGVRVFHASVGRPEVITVKGGTFDALAALTPLAHLWVSRKLPWVLLPPEVPAFDTQPDDLAGWRDGLMARVANGEDAGPPSG